MTEYLLQFIWQLQYINKNALTTTNGEVLQIIHPGQINTNEGPDFLNAAIKIGTTQLHGNIELHLNSGDWLKHKHDNNPNYNNVILHVVYHEDVILSKPFATLELQNRIPNALLGQYQKMMLAKAFIPCSQNIAEASALAITACIERMAAERLEEKAKLVFDYQKQNNNSWETSFWWLLAKNFGVTQNQALFEAVAKTISIQQLAKQKNQILYLEASLLGQAGFLADVPATDNYAVLLQKEYNFIKTKYKWLTAHGVINKLRMRPANFPEVRLAQLAAVIATNTQLFSKIIAAEKLTDLYNFFEVTANDYWHYHYSIGVAGPFKPKVLGKTMVHNIIVNTICVVVFAYGLYHNNQALKDKALRWLNELPAEQNSITKGFKALGITTQSAFETQALKQLHKFYCSQKRCLQCAIGNSIFKNTKPKL
jgi:hypothetical protein